MFTAATHAPYSLNAKICNYIINRISNNQLHHLPALHKNMASYSQEGVVKTIDLPMTLLNIHDKQSNAAADQRYIKKCFCSKKY